MKALDSGAVYDLVVVLPLLIVGLLLAIWWVRRQEERW